MKTYFLRSIGISGICAWAMLGLASAFGEQPAHGPEAACAPCGNCCPRCGCTLVPVCRTTCATTKDTTHKYNLACKDICIPAVTPICRDACGGSCRVRQVHKLVIHPVTKEKTVRGCAVEWVCPNSSCGQCASSEQTAMPAAPLPVAPVPAAPIETTLK